MHIIKLTLLNSYIVKYVHAIFLLSGNKPVGFSFNLVTAKSLFGVIFLASI